MSDQTSVNERAEKLMGRRLTPEQEASGGVLPFDCPVELGYVCPICKVVDEHGDNLCWSEYVGFLWCRTCNKDIPSALCVPYEGEPYSNGDWVNHGIDDAISVFLDTVERAAKRAGVASPKEPQT